MFTQGFEDPVVDSDRVSFRGVSNPESLRQLKTELEKQGVTLIEGWQDMLAQQVRQAIDGFMELREDMSDHRLSAFLSGRFHRSYAQLSRCFVDRFDTGIQSYFIGQRIDKSKEYLQDPALTLSDIAYKLQFSSDAHLSNQFRKRVGMTPGAYRRALGNDMVGENIEPWGVPDPA